MPTLPLNVGRRRLAAVLLLAVVAVVVAWRHVAAGAPSTGGALAVAPIRPRVAAGAGAAGSPAASRPAIVIDVVGAVHRPGLYRLPRGARVADAVARAGGLTRKAERDAVNLAAPVADGEQVVVAVRGAAAALPARGSAASASTPVSLSTASAEQLDTLPGIGPVTAQKIVAYRQGHGLFTSVADLDAIPGIGPARLAELQGLVVP